MKHLFSVEIFAPKGTDIRNIRLCVLSAIMDAQRDENFCVKDVELISSCEPEKSKERQTP